MVVVVEALNKSDDIEKDIENKIHQLTDSVKQFVSTYHNSSHDLYFPVLFENFI